MSTMEPMGPETPETIEVTPGAGNYLDALLSYGLLQGDPGAQRVDDDVQKVLGALHHVLGGGTVSIVVDSAGTSSVVDDLNTALDGALQDINLQFPTDAPNIKRF
jgi:hypothetical protein